MSDPVVSEAVGTIDGVNVDFQTTVAYQAGTVWLFLNGQLIPRDNDDGGLVEQGGVDVRLLEAPRVGDRVHFWFHTGPPTPGAFNRPPRALAAYDLRPEPTVALDLRPGARDATEEGAASDYAPRGSAALELTPDPLAGLDLVPTPKSSEVI
jgi:hypothetical protein